MRDRFLREIPRFRALAMRLHTLKRICYILLGHGKIFLSSIYNGPHCRGGDNNYFDGWSCEHRRIEATRGFWRAVRLRKKTQALKEDFSS